MIEQIYSYFTIEILYFWVNLGVLPFWILIIFFPQSYLCKYFATSIFPILILGAAYSFVIYKSYLNSYDFVGNFDLYLGIDKIFIHKSARLLADRTEFYIALVSMIVGVQFFMTGFIAELIGRSSTHRNVYLIEKEI